MIVDVVGLLIGSLIGEFVLQPETVAATKRDTEAGRDAMIAGALHTVLWATSVSVFGALPGLSRAPIVISYVDIAFYCWLLAMHYAIDCTSLRDRMMSALRLVSLTRAIEDIEATRERSDRKEVEPGWEAAMLSFAIVNGKLFDLATHSVIVFMGWTVYQWMLG